MKPLIIVLSILFSQSTLAELVEYSVRNEDTQVTNRLTFSYSNNGYKNLGEKLKFAFNKKDDTVIVLLDEFLVAVETGEAPYWHKDLRTWQPFPFITSDSVRGWVWVYYAGTTKERGHSYREEYWSNGSLVMQTETVIGETGTLLRSAVTNRAGRTLNISISEK